MSDASAERAAGQSARRMQKALNTHRAAGGGCLLRITTIAAISVTTFGLTGSADAQPGDWIHSRQDDNYHMVSQWNDVAGPYESTPHATNPTDHQWTFDDEVTNYLRGGTLAPGESVSFTETYLSDWVERVNQALAVDRRGDPLQVTVTVANQHHSRSATELGETCVVGPAYPHVQQSDHTSPYAFHVDGSETDLVHPFTPQDDGGWAVGPTTITVTVTNHTDRTKRDVRIQSLIGRPYAWLPPTRPAACDGLPVTPWSGYEPQWRSE